MDLDQQLPAPLVAAAPSTSDQADLARWIECRDETAMTRLIQRHGLVVNGVCQRICGDTSDAEDAAQATFIALSQDAARLRHADRLAAWLHRTAVRACRRLRRTQARRRRHEQRAGALAAGNAPAPHAEHDMHLDDALASLSERDRDLLLAHHCHAIPLSTLAAASGIAAEAMKKRLQRARERLARWYRRHGWQAPAVAAPGAATPLAPAKIAALSHAVCHPATLATPRALQLARQLGSMATIGAHAAHAAAGVVLSGLAIAIVEHHRMGAPPTPLRLPLRSELFMPSCMLAAITVLVWIEDAWWWWRTKETHWAPLLLLGVATLTALLCEVFMLILRGPQPLWRSGAPLSLATWMCIIIGVAYALGGAVWLGERDRNRKPIPPGAATIRGLLLSGILLQTWLGFGRWLMS